VLSEHGAEVRFYCHSTGRGTKEIAITARFVTRFEAGLSALAASLSKPRGQETLAAIQRRVGRLKEKSRGIGQHYEFVVAPDEARQNRRCHRLDENARRRFDADHCGVYCLRSSETTWDAEKPWHTYAVLTDLEAIFRGIKSELGFGPAFHHIEDSSEGHLFATVLAYQLVQSIRRKLELAEDPVLDPVARDPPGAAAVTTMFRQRDGRTLHVRKATPVEATLRRIDHAPGIEVTAGAVQKLTV